MKFSSVFLEMTLQTKDNQARKKKTDQSTAKEISLKHFDFGDHPKKSHPCTAVLVGSNQLGNFTNSDGCG